MPNKSWELVEIRDVKCLSETKGGALRCVSSDGVEFFVPIKLIGDDSEVYQAGTEGVLQIPEWLAIEKELV